MIDTTSPKNRILWIEEQSPEYDPLLEKLQELFDKENVVVRRTESEGRNELKNKNYQILLLDLMMPITPEQRALNLVSLNAGLRILYDLRNNNNWKTDRKCNVVVFTARGNQEALDKAKELIAGNGNLIEKPQILENVILEIQKWLPTR